MKPALDEELGAPLVAPVAAARAAAAAPTVALRDLIALGKPRITMMVLITTAGGIWLAPSPLHLARAMITLIGVALIVAAANAFNMYLERDVDALMRRTRNRPLPAGRLQPEIARRRSASSAP